MPDLKKIDQYTQEIIDSAVCVRDDLLAGEQLGKKSGARLMQNIALSAQSIRQLLDLDEKVEVQE